jgi:uncharacterized phage protein (TIGR02216 family)
MAGTSPTMTKEQAMQPFPWDEAIGFGLGVLKLPPDQFWRMTPRELALAAKGLNSALNPRGGTLDRTDFVQLMQRFPDGRFSR